MVTLGSQIHIENIIYFPVPPSHEYATIVVLNLSGTHSHHEETGIIIFTKNRAYKIFSYNVMSSVIPIEIPYHVE